MKIKIIVFVAYYLPGFKAGGTLRAITNMIEYLDQDFEFFVVTSDRDLGDSVFYANVPLNQWTFIDKVRVFYCSPKQQTVFGFAKIINEVPHDILYLNSFFDPVFTLKPLLARFFGMLPSRALLLAPRGEFSEGALKLKSLKKAIYISVSRQVGLYKHVAWHASSKHEAIDIKRVFPKVNDVFIAIDLAAKVNAKLATVNQQHSGDEQHDALKIIFLSRISPMKNLDYALRLLKNINIDVIFHIYGPVEDLDYWKKCHVMIGSFPQNVQVEYCGCVIPVNVGKTFSQYDLFLFPTHGESYGHVIAESLSVGTPVLLSDQTPWRNLAADGLGFDLSLDNMSGFVEIVKSYALMSQEERNIDRLYIQTKASEILANPVHIEESRQLFYKILHQ